MDLSSYGYLDCEVVKETDKAWQIEMKDGRLQWYPKSQCRFVGERLYVPDWLLKAKEKERNE